MEICDPGAFLTAYARAFSAGYAERNATFYAAPCFTLRADGSSHIPGTAAETEKFFASVLEVYRAEGMAGFTAKDVHTRSLGTGCTDLTCDWSKRRADDTEIRAWRQTYLLKCETGSWRIAVSVLHAP